MKKLIFSILTTLTLGVKAYAFPYLVQSAAVKAAQVGTQWTNFIWSMNAGSDQSFVFHTDQQGISKVVLRFGVASSATNYPLQWESSVITLTSTGSIFQGYLSRTSLPPDRTYYAEFAGFLGTNTSGAGMSIGRGRINLQSSLFTDSNYTTQIVQQIIAGSTNEVDPVYLSDKSNIVLQVRNWATNTAVTNVSFVTGGGLSNVNHILFNRTPSGSLQAGQVMWSSGRSSPQIQLNDNVIVDWGTSVIYARATESTTINKGEVVYLNGAFNDQPTIKRASNASEPASSQVIGIAAENIASNASGFVVTGGTIYNIPTTSYSSGAKLYLGANGALQTNLPTAPLHGVFVGVVERVHANAGQIYVHIQNYQELEELSDVNVSARTTNDMLIWNGSVWTNHARTNLALQSSLAGYLPLAGGAMTGDIEMGEKKLNNVSELNWYTQNYINLEEGRIYGSGWAFDAQPLDIPGYQTITGAVNAANLTNISALGFATTARVAAVEGYTNRSAGAVQRTGDVVNGSFTLDEVSTASLATNYPLILKHRAFDASAMNTMIAATTGGLRRTTTGQGSAIIWDSLNSSFATGTPIYSVSGLATGTPLYVEAAFNLNSNRITLLESYTNRAALSLSSSVWASADSTTNYQSRVQFAASSNAINTRLTAVEGYTNRAAFALSSSVWSNADSTTNYQTRTGFILASNSISTRITALEGSVATTGTVASLQTNVAARLSSNVWANAQSTTNYLPRTGGTASGVIALGESASTFNSPNHALRMNHRDFNAQAITTDITATTGGLRRATTGQSAAKIFDSSNISSGDVSVAEIDPVFTNWLSTFTIGTNIAISNLLPKTEFNAADSTTNYVLRNTYNAADSTTNYASRVTFGSFTSAYATADATTNYASRITFNSTSNSFDTRISNVATGAVYITNLSAIAGSGLGVTSNRLVVTNVALVTGSSITNISLIYGMNSTASGIVSNLIIQAGSQTNIGSGRNGILILSGGTNNWSSDVAPIVAGDPARTGTQKFMADTIEGYGEEYSYVLGSGKNLTIRGGYGWNPMNGGNLILSGGQTAGVGQSGLIVLQSSVNAGGNSITNIGLLQGNAAGLTNFPSSLLTASQGNTNYWRRTTAPTGAMAYGESGQIAVDSTNVFVYSANALGTGTGRWLKTISDVNHNNIYLTLDSGNTNYATRTAAPTLPSSVGQFNQWSISGSNLFFYSGTSWIRFAGTTNFTGIIPQEYPVPTTLFSGYLATNNYCKITDGNALIKYYTNNASGNKYIIGKTTRSIFMPDEITTTNNYAVSGLVSTNVVIDNISTLFNVEQRTFYGSTIADAYKNINDESFLPIAEVYPSNQIRNVSFDGVKTFYSEFSYPTNFVLSFPANGSYVASPCTNLQIATTNASPSNVICIAEISGSIVPVFYYGITNESCTGTGVWGAVSGTLTTNGYTNIVSYSWNTNQFLAYTPLTAGSTGTLSLALNTFVQGMADSMSTWKGTKSWVHGFMIPRAKNVFTFERRTVAGGASAAATWETDYSLKMGFNVGNVISAPSTITVFGPNKFIDTPYGEIIVFWTGQSSNVIDNTTAAYWGDEGAFSYDSVRAWRTIFAQKPLEYPSDQTMILRVSRNSQSGASSAQFKFMPALQSQNISSSIDNDPLRNQFGSFSPNYEINVFFWDLPEISGFTNNYSMIQRFGTNSVIVTNGVSIDRPFAAKLKSKGIQFQADSTGQYP